MVGVVMAFSFLYGYLPNTKVKISVACIGGIVAGILWYYTQWAYVKFQIGVTSYNAIYGAFATLPIFLIWLYLNWIIVLLGAEVSFAVQNYKTYSPSELTTKLSPANIFRIACIIVSEICREFEKDGGPWSDLDFQKKHNLPRGFIRWILNNLRDSNIITKVGKTHYLPSKNPRKITLDNIYESICGGQDGMKIALTDSEQMVVDQIEKEESLFREKLSNVTPLA